MRVIFYGGSFDMRINRRGEHAADAVADRDPGVGDLGGAVPRIGPRFLQSVHAVHPGIHIGKAAAIGLEGELAPGACVSLSDDATFALHATGAETSGLMSALQPAAGALLLICGRRRDVSCG